MMYLRRKSVNLACALLPAAAALVLLACKPAVQTIVERPEVWCAGTSDHASGIEKPRDTSALYDPGEQTIRLSGAVRETVAFEFVLAAGNSHAVGLEVRMEDLIGPEGGIPKEAFRAYRHWPVTISRFPNWYLRLGLQRGDIEFPDALVPIETLDYGQPFTLAPGERLPLWVEIHIPESTMPGVYMGTLLVVSPDRTPETTTIELTVRDIYLSPADRLPMPARVQLAPIIAAHTELDPENLRVALADADATRSIDRTFKLLHEHGLSPYTDDLRPWFDQDQSGQVVFDWSLYDAWCGPYIDGTAYDDGEAASAWPLPVDLTQPDPRQYGGVQSAVYSSVLKDYVTKAAAHFEEKGWFDRTFVSFGVPESANPGEEDIDVVRQLAAITKLAGPRLPFMSHLIPQPMAPFGWFEHRHDDLSGTIDIWTTPCRYYHRPTMERLRQLGKRTWMSPDRPPFSGSLAVEAPPVQSRSIPWQAFLQGDDAVWIANTTRWPKALLDEPICRRGEPSDAWLVYPGRWFGLDAPIPSVRLKQLMLGAQDYQYLKLLDASGRGASARLIAGSLIKASGTGAYGDNYQDGLFGRRADEGRAWELARRLLVDELADALSPTPGETLDVDENKAIWAKFLAATRGIEVWTESARLTQGDRGENPGYLLSYDFAIRNELRTPISGRLAFGELVEPLRSMSDIVRVGPIGEMGLARGQLVAETPRLPTYGIDGHFTQEVVFDAGTSGAVTTTATVSVVSVPRSMMPIVVDGDLSDWPPSEYNAVGDFRLLNGRNDGATDGERAESRTIAFLCQRDDTLFIGLHASSPAKADAGGATRFSNVVTYEDLVPIGADLIEILIDPTNAATQSGELYHIVLQATGDPVFERGIGMNPPIGEWRPWPGRPPAYCVTHTEYGWSAEISIPIDAFGDDAKKRPIWGFNMARLEPIRGEYSDWARAPRYCYDPRTLGNMVWPNE